MSKSKSVRPSVSLDKCLAHLEGLEGLKFKVTPKANWVKVEGPNGHRIYIAKTPEVRDIHLSGFGEGMDGTLPLSKPNGSVQAQLDLSLGEDMVLSLIGDLVKHIQELPRTARGSKAPAPVVTAFERK